jgi:hypothetical protein
MTPAEFMRKMDIVVLLANQNHKGNRLKTEQLS